MIQLGGHLEGRKVELVGQVGEERGGEVIIARGQGGPVPAGGIGQRVGGDVESELSTYL